MRIAMKLESKAPGGPLETKWTRVQSRDQTGKPGQQAQVQSSSSAPAWRAARRRPRWPSSATRSNRSASRTARAVPTASPRKAASTPPRTIKTTATAFIGCSTTRSKAATSAPAKPTSIASREVSVNIIDQCVAQGVPFAREYGGLLANRSFGGAQVSRTFYCRGQTGQQLLLGAYQALVPANRAAARCKMYPRTEMLDLVVDRRPRAEASSFAISSPARSHRTLADAVVLATGGYGNVFYLSTNAKGCNVTATWRAYKKGACFANPCYTQIHPTCIPVSGDHQSKLTLMSESLRNDGRVWVPKSKATMRHASSNSRSRTRLLSRTQISELRQPRPARHFFARGQGSLRRRPRRRPRRTRRLSRFRRRHQTPRRSKRSRNVTAISSTCTKTSPARMLTNSRCAFTPPCITRWADCGSITT